MTKQGNFVNRAALASTFGISLPTVDEWVSHGCPVVERGGRGREWRFDTAAVFRWRIDRGEQRAGGGADPKETARRKAEAAADREEIARDLERIKLARETGTVVSVDEVAAMVEDEYAAVRSRLLAIRGNLAGRLGDLEAERAAELLEVVDTEIREALEELTGDLGRHRARDDDPTGT